MRCRDGAQARLSPQDLAQEVDHFAQIAVGAFDKQEPASAQIAAQKSLLLRAEHGQDVLVVGRQGVLEEEMDGVLEQLLRQEVLVGLVPHPRQQMGVVAQVAAQGIERTAPRARSIDAQLGEVHVAGQVAPGRSTADDGGVVLVGPGHVLQPQEVHRGDAHAIGQAQRRGRDHLFALQDRRVFLLANADLAQRQGGCRSLYLGRGRLAL